jgi:MFS transporter, YQGE family, putative transporter
MISVLVFLSTGTEMALGTFGLINSGVSFLAYFAVSRLIKKEQRLKSILLGGIILYAAIFLIAFDVTYTRLLIYAAVIAVAYPLLLVPYLSITYDVIGSGWKAAEMRVEYIVVREVYLNAGRVFSILLFLAMINIMDAKQGLTILFLILGAGHSLIYLFIRRIHIEIPT